MNSSLYIGSTGMKGLSEGMSVTSNNLANVSTIGYKKQDILFSDLISQSQGATGEWWNNQQDSMVAIGQVGMGVQVEAVRTSFVNGDLQSTNNMTDLALDGKGFFQVSDAQGGVYYTRAGDFITDYEGVWRTSSGLALNGYKINADGSRGELGNVQIDKFSEMPAQATSQISVTMNFNNLQDNTPSDSENPYFGMLEAYDGSQMVPLQSENYSQSQQMTIYDADGTKHTITAYYDGAGTKGGNKYVEFLLAGSGSEKFDEDGNLLPGEAGDGLLMSGILEFDSSGNLVNISAFSPSEDGSKDLSKWGAAQLKDGNPAININGQEIGIDFGLSVGESWENVPASAASVGTDASGLPRVGEDAVRSDYPSTAYNTTAMTNSYKQDGYTGGTISNLSITSDGVIVGYFDNGQNMDLWEIPVARFTSEDGLYREGGNLFSATEASGAVELGKAGTENYGSIQAYNIEGSNVDIAQEFVNMIITQRGFQSNSKVVTTADEILKKAMELKRT